MFYSDIREELKTGDIVLFSGIGGLSTAIKQLTNSVWSHVGMVFKMPEYNSIFLWESTTLCNIADAIDGKFKRGVQMVLLSERIKHYDGNVAIRQLNSALDSASITSLINFRKEVKDKPYETSKLQLLKAAYDGFLGENKSADLSSLFCSELVAEAFQRIGILGTRLPSNEYTPSDFSLIKSAGLEWLKGTDLGPELPITYDLGHMDDEYY